VTILVSIEVILTSIVTILASIEQVNTPLDKIPNPQNIFLFFRESIYCTGPLLKPKLINPQGQEAIIGDAIAEETMMGLS